MSITTYGEIKFFKSNLLQKAISHNGLKRQVENLLAN